MYSTPMREEPIWVARRMRWLSPPERVPALAADRVRYCSPTDWQEAQPGPDLLQDLLRRSGLRLGEGAGWSTKSRASVDRLVAEGVDVHPPHGDRQGLLLQPAAAGRWGRGTRLMHSSSSSPAGVGLGLPVAAAPGC